MLVLVVFAYLVLSLVSVHAESSDAQVDPGYTTD